MKLFVVVLTLAISASCRNLGGIAGSPLEQLNGSEFNQLSQAETANPTKISSSENTVNVEQQPSDSPSSALSPWSAWMNLKAPPAAFLLPKKKTFPPFLVAPSRPVAPSPGEVEAPWVAWTKLKAPPAFVLPITPVKTPGVPDSEGENEPAQAPATEGQSIEAPWVTWTKLKAPPSAPIKTPGVAPTGPVEAPWTAWTNLKLPLAAGALASSLPPKPKPLPLESKGPLAAPKETTLADNGEGTSEYIANYMSPTPEAPATGGDAESESTNPEIPIEFLKPYLEKMLNLKPDEKIPTDDKISSVPLGAPVPFTPIPPGNPVSEEAILSPPGPITKPFYPVPVGRVPLSKVPQASPSILPEQLPYILALQEAEKLSPPKPEVPSVEEILQNATPEEKAMLLNPAVIEYITTKLQEKVLPSTVPSIPLSTVRPEPPVQLSVEEIYQKATPEEKAMLLNPATVEYIKAKLGEGVLPAVPMNPKVNLELPAKLSVEEILAKATPEETAMLLNPGIVEYMKLKIDEGIVPTPTPSVLEANPVKLSVQEILEKATPEEKAMLLNPAIIEYISLKLKEEDAAPTPIALEPKQPVPLSVEEVLQKATPEEKALLLNPAVIKYIQSKLDASVPLSPTIGPVPAVPYPIVESSKIPPAIPQPLFPTVTSPVPAAVKPIFPWTKPAYPFFTPTADIPNWLSPTTVPQPAYPPIKPTVTELEYPEIYQAILSPYLPKPTSAPTFSPLPPVNTSLPGLAVAEDKLLVKWAKKIFDMQKNYTLAPTMKKSLIESAWIDWLKLHNLTTLPSGIVLPVPPTATKTPTPDDIKELITWLDSIGAMPTEPAKIAQLAEWLETLIPTPEVSDVISPSELPPPTAFPYPVVADVPSAPIPPPSPISPVFTIPELQQLGILPQPIVPSPVLTPVESPEVAYPIETINEIVKTAPPEVKAKWEAVLAAYNIPVPVIDSPDQPPVWTPPVTPPEFIFPNPEPPVPASVAEWLQMINPPAVVSPPVVSPEVSYPIEAIVEMMKTAPPEVKVKWEAIMKENNIPIPLNPEPFPLSPAEVNVVPLPVPTLSEWLQANIPPKVLETAVTPTPVETDELAETATALAGLEELTPAQFSILLKKVLEECNKTTILTPKKRSSSHRNGHHEKPTDDYQYPAEMKRALYPSQSLDPASPTPISTQSKLDLVPQEFWDLVPTVAPNTTLLDPGYWAAKKSMFISKLFDALARVTLNYTNSATTTENPKQKLMKQIDTVLLSDAARSIKGKYEDSEETSTDDEDLINSEEPENLPKEPDNPLHKLFKFGVQKTILSDISTTTSPAYGPAPPTITSTTPVPTTPGLDKQKILLDKLKAAYKSSKNHHRNSKKHKSKSNKSRKSTTTVSPIDFEELAKALLVQPSK